jgi:hypothetical protein
MVFEIVANDEVSVGLAGNPSEAALDDRPLVILLHGYPQTFHTWREQVPALESAGYLAVAPNQRGYSSGARPQVLDQYATEYLVADVIALAAELESRGVVAAASGRVRKGIDRRSRTSGALAPSSNLSSTRHGQAAARGRRQAFAPLVG